MKSPIQHWIVIVALSCVSGMLMATALYFAAWVAGFTVQRSVALIVGVVTAIIMALEVRRLLR